LLAVTVFLLAGLIVEAKLKSVKNRPIDADSRELRGLAKGTEVVNASIA
jgi:hypothetical protein